MMLGFNFPDNSYGRGVNWCAVDRKVGSTHVFDQLYTTNVLSACFPRLVCDLAVRKHQDNILLLLLWLTGEVDTPSRDRDTS